MLMKLTWFFLHETEVCQRDTRQYKYSRYNCYYNPYHFDILGSCKHATRVQIESSGDYLFVRVAIFPGLPEDWDFLSQNCTSVLISFYMDPR